MKRNVGAVAFALGVGFLASGCDQLRAVQGAQQTYQVVVDSNASVGAKACAVLNWGVPIALQRAGTFSARQQDYIDFGRAVVASSCATGDLTDSQRIAAAADAMSKALWKVVP